MAGLNYPGCSLESLRGAEKKFSQNYFFIEIFENYFCKRGHEWDFANIAYSDSHGWGIFGPQNWGLGRGSPPDPRLLFFLSLFSCTVSMSVVIGTCVYKYSSYNNANAINLPQGWNYQDTCASR